MRASLSLNISVWAAWLPGEEAPTHGELACHFGPVPAALRRRLTPIGRKVLEVAWLAAAGLDQPRIIISSRHGEYARTYALLNTLIETGEVSPTEFSRSVHHALVGLLSIATGNRAGHSAVAAGPDSFASGLLEAAACVEEDRHPVLLLYFDEPLPDAYVKLMVNDEPAIALALALVPRDWKGNETIVLDFRPRFDEPSSSLALGFVDFLMSEARVGKWASERIAFRGERVG